MNRSHFCQDCCYSVLLALFAVILVCLLPLSGCASSEPDAQPEPTTTAPADDAQMSTLPAELTYEQFCQQMEACEGVAVESESVTLALLEQQLPDFAQSVAEDPEQISLFCFQDLLDATDGTNPIRLQDAPRHSEPTQTERTKAAIVRGIIDSYDPCADMEDFEAEEDFIWLALYANRVIEQFAELDCSLDDAFYEDHPIQKQFLTAVLREPSWRMWRATLVVSPTDDVEAQIVRVDAMNCFISLFETGECPENITITPSLSTDTNQLCTELTKWTVLQTDNQAVTLQVVTGEGNSVDIVYTE